MCPYVLLSLCHVVLMYFFFVLRYLFHEIRQVTHVCMFLQYKYSCIHIPPFLFEGEYVFYDRGVLEGLLTLGFKERILYTKVYAKKSVKL